MSLIAGVTALAQAIGADIKALYSGKVDKVAGKGLSANDYTTTEKNQLAALGGAVPGFDNLVVNAAATGTVTLDVSAATVFDITLSANTTIAFSNVPTPTNQCFSWVVRIRQASTLRTLTWPTTSWLTTNGITPATPAVSKVAEYIFTTNNGTTIMGRKGAST